MIFSKFNDFLFNEEKIKGGKSSGMNVASIANKHGVDISVITSELEKGKKVEKEHTPDEEMAIEIAMDHLVEDPRYYTKLLKAKL